MHTAIKMTQSQSQSISIPDAQPDPFHDFFKPDPLPDSLSEISDSREIPDSQESSDSTHTIHAPETSRDDRIAIQNISF